MPLNLSLSKIFNICVCMKHSIFGRHLRLTSVTRCDNSAVWRAVLPVCLPPLSLHWTPAEPPPPPSRCTAGSGSPSPGWRWTPSPPTQNHYFHWCDPLKKWQNTKHIKPDNKSVLCKLLATLTRNSELECRMLPLHNEYRKPYLFA